MTSSVACKWASANLGNSLAALKKLVFDERVLTKTQVWQALQENFEGVEGERIRQMLLNKAPKFGNNLDEVDQLLVEAYNECIVDRTKHPE